MKRRNYFAYIAITLVLTASAAMPQGRTKQAKKTKSPGSTSSQVAPSSGATTAATSVGGSGTVGQLVKWTGSGFLGNSIITETKTGEIGIGTTTPGSKLSVQGMIETTLGGLKFPDGTVQTTAGLASIFHDATLQGDGSASSPLGVVPLLTDVTLKGDAFTQPLGLRVPLFLSGNQGNAALGVLNVENIMAGSASAIVARGSRADAANIGGLGLLTFGGPSSATSQGGVGLFSTGGDATAANVNGNSGSISQGGDAENGSGGRGAILAGGTGSGAGHRGGTGLDARGGSGLDGAADGLAGDFFGDVEISGNLSKGGGSFKIDHPLDPENKYLYHSFVESPDMMNIYNGIVTTDANGDATVTLPDWFEALNQDFRYQLTVIGTFAQAIVAEEVKDNRFLVKTSAPNIKVSWQVTGIRHDAYANKHRIPVEEQKPEEERGLFLHPDAFNKSADKGVQSIKIAPRSKN